MFLKVCCIQSVEEMRLVANSSAAGRAVHVGLVGAMPSGPGVISDDEIARLAQVAPLGVTPVLLTSRTDASDIVAHVAATGVSAVQIVNTVAVEVRLAVRAELPRVTILQVVHVEGAESVGVAQSASIGSDYVLLDSGRPSAPTPELGGTGRTHNWSVSAEIVTRLNVPVVLAGGLNPDNVREAIRAVRPAGVDVCSGLRDAEGALIAERFHAFASASLAAFVSGA